ncbi:MAG: cytochrome-c oxidase, cbb3-type subunit III [Anderseniella sp.]|jgi:cytochrome c oxidase cbb3-type subunit 3|nr:cytochrome-c oxidase, cbb3-type subunit III [Anderseniella sp.]
MADKEIDKVSGVETTGHEWDGIKELNNPLPRWWLWTFYATIVFSVGYMAYYPAIPLIEGSTMGISGQTNRSVLQQELKAASEANAGLVSRIETSSLQDIRTNDELFRFAVAGGQSLYKVNCSQCHGSGAQGAPGYPNLNDDDWLWGGDLDAIYTTIKHGVRNGTADARDSLMPAYGEGILEAPQIVQVANYVMQLSGQEHDAASASTGKELYAENCAACHGEDGKGGRDFGAPNLADQLWLYGGTVDQVATQISKPKHGVMPAWGPKLDEAEVKKLTVYVHSLGGGEQSPATQ